MLSNITRHKQALTPEPSVELLVPSDWFRLYITIIHIGISTASMERNLVKRNHTGSLNQFVAPIGDNEDNKGEVGKEEL